MALFKSTILAQISGSVNGITFSHNRGGAYARNRSLVSNPQTDRQSQVRTALASLSTMWRDGLTPEERELWRNFGATNTVTNRIGDQITLSGIAAFQRINLFRMSTIGTTPITTPPAAVVGKEPPPAFVRLDPVNDIVTGPAMNPVLTSSLMGSGYALAYYYSGPLSPGIKYFRGPYLAHGTQAGGGNIDLPALGDAETAAGMSIATKLTLYDVDTNLPVWTIHTDPMIIPVAEP